MVLLLLLLLMMSMTLLVPSLWLLLRQGGVILSLDVSLLWLLACACILFAFLTFVPP
jgi:hypothetical protein